MALSALAVLVFVIFTTLSPPLVSDARTIPFLKLPSDRGDGVDSVGTRWAVLIAGSSGFGNYRHQADVCHAYQVLKNGGLKDENIIVFMYDDIAYNVENPRPGVIINHPQGGDVYEGVPKDYIGQDVNVDNFLAVILGNKTSLTGGSGKVVDSGPNDHIFIFYSDHGGPGVLGMPTYPYLYADDLVAVLKKKHAMGTYRSMVFYLEACESGSIFEGLLPVDINIYATTASNAVESSWGTYCPGGNWNRYLLNNIEVFSTPDDKYLGDYTTRIVTAGGHGGEVVSYEEPHIEAAYFGFLACSLLRLFTKSHENYVKAWRHITIGFLTFYGQEVEIYISKPLRSQLYKDFQSGWLQILVLNNPFIGCYVSVVLMMWQKA